MGWRVTFGDTLNVDEVHCLNFVSYGYPTLQIAQELGISEHTVKSRADCVLRKLGASNRAHAVRLGFEAGYLSSSLKN